MIDAIAIITTHVLLLTAFWRLRARDDLDYEAPPNEHHRAPGFGWRGSEKR